MSNTPYNPAVHDNDCGGSRFGCKVRNAEAGIAMCAGCAEREAQRLDEQAAQARSNYCKMFGHDWVLNAEGANVVIRCTNQCETSGKYKAVPL